MCRSSLRVDGQDPRLQRRDSPDHRWAGLSARFRRPPSPGRRARGIIDIQGEDLVAIVPAHLWPDICPSWSLGLRQTDSRKTKTTDTPDPATAAMSNPKRSSVGCGRSSRRPCRCAPEARHEHLVEEANPNTVISQLTEFGNSRPDTSNRDGQEEVGGPHNTSPDAMAGPESRSVPIAQGSPRTACTGRHRPR